MREYQLVVPMTGTGQRFKDAGYPELKPLIKVNEQSFFEHVANMFANVEDILFIISKEEPQKQELMKEIASSYPQAKIFEIAPHKLGPSYAVLQAADQISETKKIIIAYCDFHAVWNFSEMLEQLDKMDGSILTYTGFHPHMFRNSKYAYVRKHGTYVIDIQEKTPFTNLPMNEEASAGCYGFSTKRILIDALRDQIDLNFNFNGEFYTSLTYKPIIQNGGKVGTILAQQFSQWGTPEDLADWRYWDACRKHNVLTCDACCVNSDLAMTSLILAAGAGKRISKFTATSKPNIPVGKLRLWEYSNNLAKRGSTFVISRKEVKIDISETEQVELVEIAGMTEGQAMTASLGLELVEEENRNPVHILSSDNIICGDAIDAAMRAVESADLVVWSVSGYPPAQYSPEHYSWLIVDSQKRIQGVAAKTAPQNPQNAPMVIGNFTFKSAEIARKLIRLLKLQNIRINNEFYLDSTIEIALEQGLKVSYFEVTSFFALGTELELNIYNYYRNFAGDFNE